MRSPALQPVWFRRPFVGGCKWCALLFWWIRERLRIMEGNSKKIQLIDMQGRMVTSVESNDPTTIIDTRNLLPGLYIVKVNDGKTSPPDDWLSNDLLDLRASP